MFPPIHAHIGIFVEGKERLKENHQGCLLKEKSKEAMANVDFSRTQIFLAI